MFRVNLRAVRAPHGLSRHVQPAPLASRHPILSIAQRSSASLCHKRDRRFAPQKPPVPLAHTIERVSLFPSAFCALLPQSFSKERKSSPSFSSACARFCGNGGCALLQRINCPLSMIYKLGKEPITQKSGESTPINRSAGPQPNPSHGKVDAAPSRP